jgi:hypothetical protein
LSTYTFTEGAFVLCKDRSTDRIEGKYAKRAKAQKPADARAKHLEGRCEKKCFRTADQVKLAVSRAEFARKRAEEEGRSTRRREVRWFECFNHSVRMFHLTSVDEADYNARFEASKRGEFAHVA